MAAPAQDLSPNGNAWTHFMEKTAGAHETEADNVRYSGILTKINQRGKRNKRTFLLTDHAIYIIKGKIKAVNLQWRLGLKDLNSVSISSFAGQSDSVGQFILHVPPSFHGGKTKDHDYLFECDTAAQFNLIISKMREQAEHHKFTVRTLPEASCGDGVAWHTILMREIAKTKMILLNASDFHDLFKGDDEEKTVKDDEVKQHRQPLRRHQNQRRSAAHKKSRSVKRSDSDLVLLDDIIALVDCCMCGEPIEDDDAPKFHGHEDLCPKCVAKWRAKNDGCPKCGPGIEISRFSTKTYM